MPKVVKIGVCQENGNEIVSLNEVLVVKGQGLTGDRHLKIEHFNNTTRYNRLLILLFYFTFTRYIKYMCTWVTPTYSISL